VSGIDFTGLRVALAELETTSEAHRRGMYGIADSVDALAEALRRHGRKVPRRVSKLTRALRQETDATAYHIERTRAHADALCDWMQAEVRAATPE
jgi:tRNA A37 threonylcarbamoyladenosine modification protein TsaB